MTDVWWAELSAARPALRALLPASESARLDRYRRAEDASRHLVGWALARVILAAALGCQPLLVPIERMCTHCHRDGHGKPALRGGGPQFSISHAGRLVAVAVSDNGAVGVDVEMDTARGGAVDSLVRAPDEEPAQGHDLIRRWVRKEAVLKATGDGLRVPMTGFAVSPADARARLLTWPADPGLTRRLELRDLACPAGYAAALAVIGPAVTPPAHRDGSALLAGFG